MGLPAPSRLSKSPASWALWMRSSIQVSQLFPAGLCSVMAPPPGPAYDSLSYSTGWRSWVTAPPSVPAAGSLCSREYRADKIDDRFPLRQVSHPRGNRTAWLAPHVVTDNRALAFGPGLDGPAALDARHAHVPAIGGGSRFVGAREGHLVALGLAVDAPANSHGVIAVSGDRHGDLFVGDPFVPGIRQKV